jgi:hypothetical protein
VLESVDVTGTDNVGQSFHPNRHHRPRDNAKIREGARGLLRHECLPRGYPTARTAETTYQHRMMAPAARHRRDHRPKLPLQKQGANQTRLTPEREPHTRSRPAPLPHACTTSTHSQPPSPALPAVGKPAPHISAKIGEVHAQEGSSEACHGCRSTPSSDLATDRPMVRSRGVPPRSRSGQQGDEATRGQQQRETSPAWTKTSEHRYQEA